MRKTSTRPLGAYALDYRFGEEEFQRNEHSEGHRSGRLLGRSPPVDEVVSQVNLLHSPREVYDWADLLKVAEVVAARGVAGLPPALGGTGLWGFRVSRLVSLILR